MDADDELDLVLAALANRRRRRIVASLAIRPASIAQLAREQQSSLPAFHRHVTALEEAGLVHRRKAGRTTYLALTRSGLLTVQDWVGQFQAYWGTPDESLENYIASIIRESTPKGTDQ